MAKRAHDAALEEEETRCTRKSVAKRAHGGLKDQETSCRRNVAKRAQRALVDALGETKARNTVAASAHDSDLGVEDKFSTRDTDGDSDCSDYLVEGNDCRYRFVLSRKHEFSWVHHVVLYKPTTLWPIPYTPYSEMFKVCCFFSRGKFLCRVVGVLSPIKSRTLPKKKKKKDISLSTKNHPE